MAARRASSLLLLSAAASALLLSRCREPTQIMLEVTTDASCVDVRGTSITVGSAAAVEQKSPAARTTHCSSGRVGSLAVVPSGDKDDEVAVRVVTGVGKSPEACIDDGYQGGCIVARRILRFLPHTPVELPVFMGIDCLDIPCGATQTCFKGQCVPAKVDCSGTRGCVPNVGDGGVNDAGQDSGGTGGAGGTDAAGGSSGSGGSGGSDAGDAAPDALVCSGTTADCNNSAADGCEVDLSSDGANCGTCGRDCVGGTCTAGACSPATLWTEAQATPTRLALDATHVYFVDFNNGAVRSVPKLGGPAVLLASGKNATRVAVDGSYVYFTNGSQAEINRVPTLGGTTELVATLPQVATGLTVDTTYVYSSETAATGRIHRIPEGGGVPTVLATSSWPIDLAVNSTHVYWPSYENNGALRRVPISGGSFETLDSNTDNGFAVALDATHVYWTVLGTGANKGEIRRLPLAGGTAEVLAVTQAGPRGIAVDATHVYWTNSDDGTVRRIAKDGSDNQVPATLSSGGIEPLGIAVDATAVYWADDKAHVLRRLTK
ncbi:MAG: DUF5050 domain-containing protein [Polyangiaceae bacterium]